MQCSNFKQPTKACLINSVPGTCKKNNEALTTSFKQGWLFLPNQPMPKQECFIPTKPTFDHSDTQSSSVIRKPHDQSSKTPVNHNSAASNLTQVRMLKINIILLNNASVTVILLNVTQTTVTQLSGISTTVALSIK